MVETYVIWQNSVLFWHMVFILLYWDLCLGWIFIIVFSILKSEIDFKIYFKIWKYPSDFSKEFIISV